jgi:hypothetical protein
MLGAIYTWNGGSGIYQRKMLQLCSDILLFTITYMIDRILDSLQLPWCYMATNGCSTSKQGVNSHVLNV